MRGSSVAGNCHCSCRLFPDAYQGSRRRAKQTGSVNTTNSAKISEVLAEPLKERLGCALSDLATRHGHSFQGPLAA